MKAHATILAVTTALALAGCGGGKGQPSLPGEQVSIDKTSASVKAGQDVKVHLTFSNFLLGCAQVSSSISLTNNDAFSLSTSNFQCTDDKFNGGSGSIDLDLRAKDSGGTSQITFFATNLGKFTNTAPIMHYIANNLSFLLFENHREGGNKQGSIAVSDHIRLYSDNSDMQDSTLVLSSKDSNKSISLTCKNPISTADAPFASCQYDLSRDAYNNHYDSAQIHFKDGSLSYPASAEFVGGLLALKNGNLYYQQNKYLNLADWVNDNPSATLSGMQNASTQSIAQDSKTNSTWIKLSSSMPDNVDQLVGLRTSSGKSIQMLSSIWSVSGASGNLTVNKYDADANNHVNISSNLQNAKLFKSSVTADKMYLLSRKQTDSDSDYTITSYSGESTAPIDSTWTLSDSSNYQVVNILTSENQSDGSENIYVLMKNETDANSFGIYTIKVDGSGHNEPVSMQTINNTTGSTELHVRLIHVAKLNAANTAQEDNVRLFASYEGSITSAWHVQALPITSGYPITIKSVPPGEKSISIPGRPLAYGVYTSDYSSGKYQYNLVFDQHYRPSSDPSKDYDLHTQSHYDPSTGGYSFPIIMSANNDDFYSSITTNSSLQESYWVYNDGKSKSFVQGSMPLQGPGLSFAEPVQDDQGDAGRWILQAV